jgi:hypothetical protein
VELERVLGLELGVGQDAQRLEHDDGAGAVVLGARAASGRRPTRAVEVRAGNDQVGRVARDLDDDGGLVEGVAELSDGDGGVDGGDRLGGVEEPVGGFRAVAAAVVTVVEAKGVLLAWKCLLFWRKGHVLGEALEPALRVAGANLGDQRVGNGLPGGAGRVGDGPGLNGGLGVRGGEEGKDLRVLWLSASWTVVSEGWKSYSNVGDVDEVLALGGVL